MLRISVPSLLIVLAVAGNSSSRAQTLKLIPNVPDLNQPPPSGLPPVCRDNFCAPTAALNVVKYWNGKPGAVDVNLQMPDGLAVQYLAWFMATNDRYDRNCGQQNQRVWGRSARTGGGSGTHVDDIAPAVREYVRWDGAHASYQGHWGGSASGPIVLPAFKRGYDWRVETRKAADYPTLTDAMADHVAQINAGKPTVTIFEHWNLSPIAEIDEVHYFDWGEEGGSEETPHGEVWDPDTNLGHAVTGVGYHLGFDPDGNGARDWLIVHDNWGSTPVDVAVPFDATWKAHTLFPNNLQFPGDCNQDGALDISDAVCLLRFLFIGKDPARLPCGNGGRWHRANLTLLDANGDGALTLTDAVHVLRYKYVGGPAHAEGTACRIIESCPDNTENCTGC